MLAMHCPCLQGLGFDTATFGRLDKSRRTETLRDSRQILERQIEIDEYREISLFTTLLPILDHSIPRRSAGWPYSPNHVFRRPNAYNHRSQRRYTYLEINPSELPC